jgi:transcriptional regulator with XRE-family HTH domain
MSLHTTFAANLRRLFESRDSISAVSRSTGINRQQLARYLSGRSLPNGRNIKRIAQYFRIAETELFLGPASSVISAEFSEAPHLALSEFSQEEIDTAISLLHPEDRSTVAPGLYYVYFANPDDPTVIMRSTLIVKRVRGHTIFRRLTCPLEEQGSWWSHFTGDHAGIVLDRRNWTYFLGINSVGVREPTLFVVQYLHGRDPMLGGHATLMDPGGPALTAVVICACPPETSLRHALRASHAYPVDDPAIDPFILDAIEQQCAALVRRVHPLTAYSSQKIV